MLCFKTQAQKCRYPAHPESLADPRVQTVLGLCWWVYLPLRAAKQQTACSQKGRGMLCGMLVCLAWKEEDEGISFFVQADSSRTPILAPKSRQVEASSGKSLNQGSQTHQSSGSQTAVLLLRELSVSLEDLQNNWVSLLQTIPIRDALYVVLSAAKCKVLYKMKPKLVDIMALMFVSRFPSGKIVPCYFLMHLR